MASEKLNKLLLLAFQNMRARKREPGLSMIGLVGDSHAYARMATYFDESIFYPLLIEEMLDFISGAASQKSRRKNRRIQS